MESRHKTGKNERSEAIVFDLGGGLLASTSHLLREFTLVSAVVAAATSIRLRTSSCRPFVDLLDRDSSRERRG